MPQAFASFCILKPSKPSRSNIAMAFCLTSISLYVSLILIPGTNINERSFIYKLFFPAKFYSPFRAGGYTQAAGIALVLVQHIGFFPAVNPRFEFPDEG